jgi:ElaB/YqjD/DUF883 family membrane-anchored ribosome-binding protein
MIMPASDKKFQEAKEKIRTHLNKARMNLEEAKTECSLIFPTWQTIENGIDEILDSLEKILEDSKTAD